MILQPGKGFFVATEDDIQKAHDGLLYLDLRKAYDECLRLNQTCIGKRYTVFAFAWPTGESREDADSRPDISIASSREAGSCSGCRAYSTAQGVTEHLVWVVSLRSLAFRLCESCRKEMVRNLSLRGVVEEDNPGESA